MQNEFMRSSFLPKCQPKFLRISVLPSNELPGQKSLEFSVGILGETMTSWIHSEFYWPSANYNFIFFICWLFRKGLFNVNNYYLFQELQELRVKFVVKNEVIHCHIDTKQGFLRRLQKYDEIFYLIRLLLSKLQSLRSGRFC